MMLKINVAALLAAGWTVAAFARVELATPFSDNMVLQRDRKVPVWGSADPGERVTVSFAGTTVEATADAKGLWRVNLPAGRWGQAPAAFLSARGAPETGAVGTGHGGVDGFGP